MHGADSDGARGRDKRGCTGLARGGALDRPDRASSALGGTAQVTSAQGVDTWVQNFRATERWPSADATEGSFGPLRQFSFLKIAAPPEANHIYVYNPKMDDYTFVDLVDVGPSGAPSAEYLSGPKEVKAINLPARVNGKSLLYDEPSLVEGVPTWPLDNNHSITVVAQVEGDARATWYKLAEGGYLKADDVRLQRERPSPTPVAGSMPISMSPAW